MPASLDHQQVMERATQGDADVDEAWRPIPGWFPFEASSLGRIRNAATGTIRKPLINHGGYEVLRPTNRSRPERVHHLVALAFIGPRPAGLVVNHVDGVKRNNRPGNLEYVTTAENLAHARRTGLSLPSVPPVAYERVPRGETHSAAKLTEADVIAARTRYRLGVTFDALAAEFGVNEATIRGAVRGTHWAHVPGAIPFQS
jgi:hypothetical protein